MATVSVCTNNDMVTDFGVFHECNNQDCAGVPQHQTESQNCTVELKLMLDKDKNYFIHVRADWINDEGGTNFTVWYTEEGDTTNGDGQNCSLCPDGSLIKDATQDVLGSVNCGDSEELLSSFLPGAQCDEFLANFNTNYDHTAFCCSNMDPQEGLCSLCEDGSSLINPDVPIFSGATCSDVFTASAYIVNETICEDFQLARPACCSGANITCQLCPNGGKAVYLEDFNCAELYQFAAFFPKRNVLTYS
jgi:hypothetical protein